MSVELQIQAPALSALTSRTVRQALRTACLPTFIGFSIDHLQVATGGEVAAGQSGVEVRIPIDVFIVTDLALFAAPNAVPDGATSAAGHFTLTFQLQVTLSKFTTPAGKSATRSVLTFAAMKPDLSRLDAPGIDIGQLENQLQAVLPSSSIDLTSQLALLGLTTGSSADVVLVDGVVAVRFDPAGAPQPQLFPGQDWGLFVDGAGVEQLVRARIAPAIEKKLPGVAVDAHFQPAGTVPHVDLSASLGIKISVFHIRVVADLPSDFSVVPGSAPLLRATVNWSVHVFADLVPGFIEKIAENFIEDAIDPSQFGGTATGDHVFVIDSPLPAIPLLGVTFRYDNAFGSPAGMTIGGAILIPGLYEPPLVITAHPLGKPTRIQLCSALAKTGSGAPSQEAPTLQTTTSYGEADITGCGAVCSFDVRTPDGSFQQYLSGPTAGTPLETATISARINYAVANGMTDALTFILRTPRGVRLISLGEAPKAEVDATGHVVGALDFYIPDCLYSVPFDDGRSGLGWGTDGRVDVNIFKPHPLENPDWTLLTQAAGGLILQAIQTTGLDAGELVRFRSGTHAIDVVADDQGFAQLPVILPLTASFGPALMTRSTGRPFDGSITVNSMALERRFTLPGRLRGAPVPTRSGGLFIETELDGVTFANAVAEHGVFSQPALQGQEDDLNPQPLPPVEIGGGLTELNPQPLPPVEAAKRIIELAKQADIRGIETVAILPGFAELSVAVGVLGDGSMLLLSTARAGELRISGTFEGPIGTIALAGDWAISEESSGIGIFRVSRSPTSNGCCTQC